MCDVMTKNLGDNFVYGQYGFVIYYNNIIVYGFFSNEINWKFFLNDFENKR